MRIFLFTFGLTLASLICNGQDPWLLDFKKAKIQEINDKIDLMTKTDGSLDDKAIKVHQFLQQLDLEQLRTLQIDLVNPVTPLFGDNKSFITIIKEQAKTQFLPDPGKPLNSVNNQNFINAIDNATATGTPQPGVAQPPKLGILSLLSSLSPVSTVITSIVGVVNGFLTSTVGGWLSKRVKSIDIANKTDKLNAFYSSLKPYVQLYSALDAVNSRQKQALITLKSKVKQDSIDFF